MTARTLVQLVATLAIAGCADPDPAAPTSADVSKAPLENALVRPTPDSALSGPKPIAGAAAKSSQLDLARAATQTSASGNADLRREVTEMRRLMGASDADLSVWRQQLDQIARHSKRGENAVRVRRTLLEALRAPSDAEYRRILGRLRASMATIELSTTLRAHLVEEVAPTGLLLVAQDVRQSDAPVAWDELPAYGDVEVRVPASHTNSPVGVGYYECSTTWDGIVYEGECATQEELDEALAILDSLNAEITAQYSEAMGECVTRYGTGGCPADYDDEETQFAWSGSLAPQHDGSPSTHLVSAVVTSGTEADSPACTASDFQSADRADAMSCAGEGLAAGAAVFGWVAAHVAANDMLRIGASRGGKVAILGVLVTGAFSTGWAIGSWVNCMME